MRNNESKQHNLTSCLSHLMVFAACVFALTCLPAAAANSSGTITAQAVSATKVAKKANTRVNQALKKADGTENVTEKLRMLFTFAENNWSYGRVYGSITSKATARQFAYDILKSKKGQGNCDSYAAGYAYMARQALGKSSKYTVRIGVGKSNGFGNGVQKHSWVEIKVKGKWYIFDPNMDQQMANSSQKYFSLKRTKKSTKKLYNNFKDVTYYTVPYKEVN